MWTQSPDYAEEAEKIAHEAASNYEFSEHVSDYETVSVKETRIKQLLLITAKLLRDIFHEFTKHKFINLILYLGFNIDKYYPDPFLCFSYILYPQNHAVQTK